MLVKECVHLNPVREGTHICEGIHDYLCGDDYFSRDLPL